MDTQDKIERYLLNRMDESEKAEFEKELVNNTLLKEQLEIELEVVKQIRRRAFVDKQIQTAKNEMKQSKTLRLKIYSVFSFAAMLVLVFFAHGVWQGHKYDQLYTSNFAIYSNDFMIADGVYRGDASIDSLQVLSMQAYEKNDFATASTLFLQILNNSDNPEIRFYLAITQMETGQTNKALTNLQILYSQPNEYRYYEQTRWYLALVHLKLHHKTEAKKYLDELIKLEGVCWDKAKKLIRKI